MLFIITEPKILYTGVRVFPEVPEVLGRCACGADIYDYEAVYCDSCGRMAHDSCVDQPNTENESCPNCSK